MRSLLFVPGDDERKIAKALGSAADALILDLEDAVAPQRKAAAREVCAAVLRTAQTPKALFVRVNALDTADHAHDLKAVAGAKPFGIVLPKCRHGSDVRQLGNALDELEAQAAIERGTIRILPIVTETAASLFGLGTYAEPASPRLYGMMWGGEDLAADIGAMANRDAEGRYTAPYELARALCLLGAAAASVLAVDAVHRLSRPGRAEGRGAPRLAQRFRRKSRDTSRADRCDQRGVYPVEFRRRVGEACRCGIR